MILSTALLAAPLFIGCNGGGDEFNRKMVSVTGKVLVKGQAIKASDTPPNVRLIFQKGTEHPETLNVKADGTFAGKAAEGENKVTFQLYGPTDAMGPIKKEFLPGGTGTLSANVAAGKEIVLEIGE